MNSHPRRKEAGSALVLCIILITVLAVFIGAALDYTLQSLRYSQRQNARSQAIDAATGALDYAFIQWRGGCQQQETETWPANHFSGLVTPNPTIYSSGSFNLTNTAANGIGFLSGTNPVAVTIQGLNGTLPTAVSSPVAPSSTPTPTQAQGPNFPTYSYLAQATVNYQTLYGGPGGSGTNSVTVSRVFQKVYSSPWLYAVFFNDDLEINPGSAMSINGSVQSNGDLYTGGGSSGDNNLTFEQPVTYAGSWTASGQWDPGNSTETPISPYGKDAAHSGTPAGPAWNTGAEPILGPQQTPENASLLTTSSTNPNVADGYHELIDVPNTAYSDPLAATSGTNDISERIYNQAGIIIEVNPSGVSTSGTYNIFYQSNPGGGAAPVQLSATATGLSGTIYKTVSNALTTNQSLYDAREKHVVSITQLNIATLLPQLSSTGSLSGSPYNIIYIWDAAYSTGTGNGSLGIAPDNQSGPGANAIQLISGSAVPTTGLTIASENPIYIQGNYNSSYSGSTMPPCAVMADAVTILSGSWVNSSQAPSTPPSASNTTINTAILSGIVTAARPGAGQTFTYSGGAENFLRLLENWGGQTLTYCGSMDEMFQSEQGTGVWRAPGTTSACYYAAPIRNWSFNIGFYTTSPPGTFTSISYVKSRWIQ